MKKRIFIIGMIFSVSCLSAQTSWAWGRQGKVISPEGEVKEIDWNEWELLKDPAKRDVSRSDHSSCHIIRIKNSEPLHTHDTHELFAIVLKGSGKFHFQDTAFDIQKGDIVHVPAGVPHWVENTGRDAIEAYAIFTPPFDGKDFHPVTTPQSPQRAAGPLYETT